MAEQTPGTPIGSVHLTAYLEMCRETHATYAYTNLIDLLIKDETITQKQAEGRIIRVLATLDGIRGRKEARAKSAALKAECAVAQAGIDRLARRHTRGATLFNAYKSAMWCWDNARRAFRNERPAEYQKGLFISKTNSAIEFRRRDRQMRKFSRGVDEAFGVDYSICGPYCIICGFNSGSHDRRCPQPDRDPWDRQASGF